MRTEVPLVENDGVVCLYRCSWHCWRSMSGGGREIDREDAIYGDTDDFAGSSERAPGGITAEGKAGYECFVPELRRERAHQRHFVHLT